MKRHKIARLLRRMADLEERRARALVLEAESVLRERKRSRDELVERMATRETAFMEDQPFVSGAVIAMLSETRVVGERQLKAMEVSISEVEGVLETRRTEHYVSLRKRDGRQELENTMRRRWRYELEQHEARELEDATSGSRWMRAQEETSDCGQDPDHLDPSPRQELPRRKMHTS